MDIYIVIIIVSIIAATILNMARGQSTRKTQIKGLSLIVKLKVLITSVQQHRGMSSAWLNGDKSKKTPLIKMEKNIQSIIDEINSTYVGQSTDRWLSFTDHWKRLIKKIETPNVANNFKQHTQMIANLLYLLEDEAENAKLNSSSLPELPNIGFVWRELISTAESVGQSRAIGTGVATAKYCSSVDKIRLSFLEQHIQTTSSDILNKLSYLDAFKNKHNELLKTAQCKMEALINTIESELVQTSKISIDQNAYFEMASSTIESMDHIFNHQIEQINSILKQH